MTRYSVPLTTWANTTAEWEPGRFEGKPDITRID